LGEGGVFEEDVSCRGNLPTITGGAGDAEFHMVVVENAFGVRIFLPLAWPCRKTEFETEDKRSGGANGKSAFSYVVGEIVGCQVDERDSWCCS
jgi:hypothetical protein